LPNLGDPADPWLADRIGDAGAWPWLGTAHTYTPTHHDLTHNALCQLSGRKRVWLAAPHATPNLYNAQHVFSPVQPNEPLDLARYPLAASVRWHECELGPGDALILPEGWWHAVLGLEENVSVSFTCWRPCVPPIVHRGGDW
jgi:ribosomal protein L16 Arg81 hydroxylase